MHVTIFLSSYLQLIKSRDFSEGHHVYFEIQYHMIIFGFKFLLWKLNSFNFEKKCNSSTTVYLKN